MTTNDPRVLKNLITLVEKWHHDRNLIDGSTDKDQVLKLLEEFSELSNSVCKGKDIRDDIGDMLVVMINIMARRKISFEECLAIAYDDIKDRKGRMIDGIFVKDADLTQEPPDAHEEFIGAAVQMTYDKATDPDAGLRLDFTSRKRDGFISSTDDSMRHEMQRMADKINQLEKRIIELEKKA